MGPKKKKKAEGVNNKGVCNQEMLGMAVPDKPRGGGHEKTV